MDITIASIVNLVSSGGLCYLGYLIRKKNRELSHLEKAKLYSPSSLLKELNQPSFLDKLAKNSNNPNEYFLKAFVEGYVECKHPTRSVIDRKTPLVYSILYKRDINFNGISVEARNVLARDRKDERIKAPLYFALRDPFTSHFGLIQNNLSVDTSGALEFIGERQKLRKLNFMEKLWGQVGKIGELAFSITKGLVAAKGISIGFSETELGIKVGSILTVYGQVIYDIKAKTLRMDTPLRFLQDKATVLRKLKEYIGKLNWGAALLLVPFILSTAYLIKKGIDHYNRLKIKKEKEELENIERIAKGKVDDGYNCIACADRPRSVIIRPCMHFSICSVCYDSLSKKTCPICRTSVDGITKVYIK